MHRGLQSLPASRQSQLQLDRSSQSVELSAALSVVPQLHCVSRGAERQELALSNAPTLSCVVHMGCHWLCLWCWKSLAPLHFPLGFVSVAVRGAERFLLHCTVHLAFILCPCPWCWKVLAPLLRALGFCFMSLSMVLEVHCSLQWLLGFYSVAVHGAESSLFHSDSI